MDHQRTIEPGHLRNWVGLTIAAVGLVLLLSMSPARANHGATYFVSPDASTGVSTDAEDPGNVWETVAAVCRSQGVSIGAGDTIVFLDGLYETSAGHVSNRSSGGFANPGIIFYRDNCGTEANPITIRSASQHGARIHFDQADIASFALGVFQFNQSSNFILDGFEIFGNDSEDEHFERGVFLNVSQSIVVINNKIHDVGGSGVGANRSTHSTIDSNEVYQTSHWSRSCGSGISLYLSRNAQGLPNGSDGYANRITNNRIHDNQVLLDSSQSTCVDSSGNASDGNCIIMDLANLEASYDVSSLIAQNECFNNGGKGIHVYGTSNVDVFDNVLYRNGRNAIRQGELSVVCTARNGKIADATNVRLERNIIWPSDSGTPLLVRENVRACSTEVDSFDRNMFVESEPDASDFFGVEYDLDLTSRRRSFRNCSSTINLADISPRQIAFRNPSTSTDADFRLRSRSVARYCD